MKKNIVIVVAGLMVFAFGVGYAFNKSSDNQTTVSTQKSDSSNNTSGKSVDLSGKQLTTIPESVLNQTDITSLNLSNNQLVTLPSEIGKLVNLGVLNVENNRLESLPPEVGQLVKLKSADFSNNRILTLPTELGTLTQLESLNLDGYKGPQSDITQLKSVLNNTEIRP